MQRYYDPIILENPLYIRYADAVKDAKAEFAIGMNQDKSLMEGYGYPQIVLSGLCTILGTFNFIPYPSVGYRGVLYLLSHLANLVTKTFHEDKKWAQTCYQRRDEEEVKK